MTLEEFRKLSQAERFAIIAEQKAAAEPDNDDEDEDEEYAGDEPQS